MINVELNNRFVFDLIKLWLVPESFSSDKFPIHGFVLLKYSHKRLGINSKLTKVK